MSNPRESLLLRYLTAFEAGDVETMLHIVQIAEHDAEFSRQLQELHQIYEQTVPMNGVYQGEQKMHILLPTYIRPQSRERTRGTLMAFAAAIVTLFCIGIVLAVQPVSRDSQPATPQNPLVNLQPITLDNLDQLQPLMMLGRGGIHDLAWSPDGETITAATERGIYHYSPEDLTIEPVKFGDVNTKIESIAYSADGSWLAGGEKSALWVWNATTGEVVTRIDSEMRSLYNVFISTHGERVAAVGCTEYQESPSYFCKTSEVTLWDTTNSRRISTLSTDGVAAFTPNMQLLAITSREGHQVTLIDLKTNKETPVWSNEFSQIRRMTFSPDGTQLALGIERTSGNRLEVYEVGELFADPLKASTKIQSNLLYSPDRVSSGIADIFFNLDSDKVMVFQSDGIVEVWDTARAAQSTRTETTGLGWTSAIPNWEGNKLITLSGDVLELWDTTTGERLALGWADSYVDLVSFPDDGTKLATSGWTSTASIWDLKHSPPMRERITAVVEGQPVYSTHAQFSPDGNFLVYGLRREKRPGVSKFMLRDMSTGEDQEIRGGQTIYNYYWAPVITQEGTMVEVHNRQRVALWKDLQAEPQIITLADRQFTSSFGIDATAISPDGRLVVMESCYVTRKQLATETTTYTPPECAETLTGLWNTETGEQVMLLEGGNIDTIFSGNFVFSPDGRTLALNRCTNDYSQSNAGGITSTVCVETFTQLWDVSEAYERLEDSTLIDDVKLEPSAVLDGTGGLNYITSFHPQRFGDKVLMAGRIFEGNAYVWTVNLASGEIETALTLDEGYNIVKFDPTEKLLALAGHGIVKFYGIPE